MRPNAEDWPHVFMQCLSPDDLSIGHHGSWRDFLNYRQNFVNQFSSVISFSATP